MHAFAFSFDHSLKHPFIQSFMHLSIYVCLSAPRLSGVGGCMWRVFVFFLPVSALYRAAVVNCIHAIFILTWNSTNLLNILPACTPCIFSPSFRCAYQRVALKHHREAVCFAVDVYEMNISTSIVLCPTVFFFFALHWLRSLFF